MSYSTIHLIAEEILGNELKAETEMKKGVITITLWVSDDVRQKVVLSLDWKNWHKLRSAGDDQFQDYEICPQAYRD